MVLCSFQGEANFFSMQIYKNTSNHLQSYDPTFTSLVYTHNNTLFLCGRENTLPLTLRELIVGLVLVVGVKVEDALNKVLTEHFGVLLEQQVDEAVFTQAKK